MKLSIFFIFILLLTLTASAQSTNTKLLSLTRQRDAANSKYLDAINKYGAEHGNTTKLQEEFVRISKELKEYKESLTKSIPDVPDLNKRSFFQRIKDFFVKLFSKSNDAVASVPTPESQETAVTETIVITPPQDKTISPEVQKKLNDISKFLSLQPVMITNQDATDMVTILGYNKSGYSTSKMLKRFQKANRLSQTGQLTEKTKEKLLENLKQMKEALKKWGHHKEFNKDTLPLDEMLKKSSKFITNLPDLLDKNGKSINTKGLLDKLTFAESSHIHKYIEKFKVNKISGSIGFGQLMPYTAKELGVNPYDPEDNLKGCSKLLSSNFKFLSKYSKDKNDLLSKGIAAYNCGPYRTAFKKYSWDELVTSGKIPRESIEYTIKIKSSLFLPLSKAEKDWVSSKGDIKMLVKNGYTDQLKKDGYL